MLALKFANALDWSHTDSTSGRVVLLQDTVFFSKSSPQTPPPIKLRTTKFAGRWALGFSISGQRASSLFVAFRVMGDNLPTLFSALNFDPTSTLLGQQLQVLIRHGKARSSLQRKVYCSCLHYSLFSPFVLLLLRC